MRTRLSSLRGRVLAYRLAPRAGVHRGGVQAGYESAKIENGPARGKKHYDKRKDIAKRDAKRDIDRRMKQQ